MAKYIHGYADWTDFTWDELKILPLLIEVRRLQGNLIGKMEMIGFVLRQEAVLDTFTNDILKSSEIEGEILNPDQVRSSIAKRLGMEIGGMVPSNKNVDGIVEIMIDATKNSQKELTQKRLFDWHAALFPTGRSGMHTINVAKWRNTEMQVLSGAMGKERVHFEAVKSDNIPVEMNKFLIWFNNYLSIDPVLKAGIAHLWFLTIHPFDDGNGRIGRTIMDMQLAKADGINQRFYSLSAQIQKQRKGYYEILEKTQKGSKEITEWLIWYLNCLKLAIENTEISLEKIMAKAHFWYKHQQAKLNGRQILMLNKLMDSFEGKLTNSKWAKMSKCSSDTALRDIQNLELSGILQKELAGGRSTNYLLIW
jgi:Fic family protein